MRILKAENDRVLPPLEGWGSGPYIVCVTKGTQRNIPNKSNQQVISSFLLSKIQLL